MAACRADSPGAVIDLHGNTQDVADKTRKAGRPKIEYPAWEFRGSAGKLLTKAQTIMETLVSAPFENIDAERRRGIAWSLAAIVDAAGTLRARLDEGTGDE